jgi:hypothetical protein
MEMGVRVPMNQKLRLSQQCRLADLLNADQEDKG